MSLRSFARPRMVVLDSSATALQAARALENNRIGAILVQQDGRLVGVVTDRDLTTRVVGFGLDPSSVRLDEIMSPEPSTLPPSASMDDAIRMMQDRNVRRIPLVEGDRIVGMVTLDDLLLDESAPIEKLAAVVQAQVGEGGPAESARTPAKLRSIARAEATYLRLLQEVRDEAALATTEQAEAVLELVLDALVRRLTSDEAKDLIAQLPSLLQPELRTLPPGPDRRITLESIKDAIVQRFDVEPDRAAELLDAVGDTLARNVSEGQMEDVRGQLPKDLRSFFSEAPL